MNYVLIFVFLGKVLGDAIALSPDTTTYQTITNPTGGMVTYSTVGFKLKIVDYLTFYVTGSVDIVTYVSDMDPTQELKPGAIIKNGMAWFTGIHYPRLDRVYYVLVKWDTAWSYSITVSQVAAQELTESLSINTQQFKPLVMTYSCKSLDPILVFKIVWEGNCNQLQFSVHENSGINDISNLPIDFRDGTVYITDYYAESTDVYLVSAVWLYKNCNITTRIYTTTYKNYATQIHNSVELTYATEIPMTYFWIQIQKDQNLYFQVISSSAIDLFFQQESFPNSDYFRYKTTANNEIQLSFTRQDQISQGELFIGVFDPSLTARYTIRAILHEEEFRLLHNDNEISDRVPHWSNINYLLEHEPRQDLDAIIKIYDVVGEIDVYAMQWANSIDNCIIHQEKIDNSLLVDSTLHRAKRIVNQRHMNVLISGTYCEHSPCWISVIVIGRSAASFKLRPVIQPYLGFKTSELRLFKGEKILLRREITKFMAVKLKTTATCPECEAMVGQMKYSRLYGDMRDAVENSQFSFEIEAAPTELMGLWYIEVCYTEGPEEFYEIQLDFTEYIAPKLTQELESKIIYYDFINQQSQSDLSQIMVYGSRLEPEPVYIWVVPLDAYLEVCLSPPSHTLKEPYDPKDHRWCTSTLNQAQEYELKIEADDEDFEYRGEYTLLIRADRFLTKEKIASFAFLYSSGDNRIALEEEISHSSEITDIHAIDAYKIVVPGHSDVYISNDGAGTEYQIFMQDESLNTVFLSQYQPMEHWFIPWETIKQHSKQEIIRLYIDARLISHEPAGYTLTYSVQSSTPQLLLEDDWVASALAPSQIKFYYLLANDVRYIHIFGKLGELEILTRIISLSSSDGRLPRDWSRPITEQYIQNKFIEEPDDVPFVISVTHDMVSMMWGGTCRIILGVMCLEKNAQCEYDITHMLADFEPIEAVEITEETVLTTPGVKKAEKKSSELLAISLVVVAALVLIGFGIQKIRSNSYLGFNQIGNEED